MNNITTKKKTIICLGCDGEMIDEKGNTCKECKGKGFLENIEIRQVLQ